MAVSILFLFLPLVAVIANYEGAVGDPPQFLSRADFERGNALVRQPEVDDPSSYDENLIEGDIEPPPGMSKIQGSGQQKNAVKRGRFKWLTHRIPYELDETKPFEQNAKTAIASAMSEIMNKTCVEFVPRRPGRPNYLVIANKGGCSSQRGRMGGRQEVKVGTCQLRPGKIVHELMHALGFYHEQARNDRDDWVEIKVENVRSGARGEFKKESLEVIDHLGTEYDYGSVMHYPAHAFAASEGLLTIVTKRPMPPGVVMGQRKGLSTNDALKINKLFKCTTRISSEWEDEDPSSALLKFLCEDENNFLRESSTHLSL